MQAVKEEKAVFGESTTPIGGMVVDAERYAYLEEGLLNRNNPLQERFRALFTLRNIADNASVDIVGKGKFEIVDLGAVWMTPQ